MDYYFSNGERGVGAEWGLGKVSQEVAHLLEDTGETWNEGGMEGGGAQNLTPPNWSQLPPWL